MKTIFRLVGGTDVDPTLLESGQPKRKRGSSGNPHGVDPSLANRPSATAENGRLRQERYEVWQMAEAATRYWRLRMEFQSAISWAQQMEIPEGRSHPSDPEDRDRQPMVDKWRAALVRQLLTPAWDTASVAWKQNALARGKYEYTGLEPDRLKHAISEDLAFLAAHPVRQSKCKTTGGLSNG
jgi:hypothetical protein